jgi:hypothetical protein
MSDNCHINGRYIGRNSFNDEIFMRLQKHVKIMLIDILGRLV